MVGHPTLIEIWISGPHRQLVSVDAVTIKKHPMPGIVSKNLTV